MILIADSGSTKCSWALCSQNGKLIKEIRTIGFNPYFIDKKNILKELEQSNLTLHNKEIKEVHGLARGNAVRARNVGRDIFAGLKNIVGGEISEYTKLQADSREQALQRLVDDAERMGANAFINLRFTTTMVMQGCSEMLAYGTAVTLQ